MSFCGYCGTALTETMNFCPRCGTDVVAFRKQADLNSDVSNKHNELTQDISEQKTFDFYLNGVQTGDAFSMYKIAFFFYMDYKSPHYNFKEALQLFKRAAEAGNIDAMIALFSLYLGTGNCEYIDELVEQGNKLAALIADYICIAERNGLKENSDKSSYWLRKAMLENDGFANDFHPIMSYIAKRIEEDEEFDDD